MGAYAVIAACGLCDSVFTANPERVPCFPLRRHAADGTALAPMDGRRLNAAASKEPVCRECFAAINRFREQNGEPTHVARDGAWEATEALD